MRSSVFLDGGVDAVWSRNEGGHRRSWEGRKILLGKNLPKKKMALIAGSTLLGQDGVGDEQHPWVKTTSLAS